MPPLWFCRSKTISCLNSAGRRCWRQVLRRVFLAAREGNDRQTVDGNNSVQFKTTFVSVHTKGLILNEWVIKNLRCDYKWKIELNLLICCGPFVVVVVISKFFAKLFRCHKFYRPSNSQREFGKIQPIAELTFSRALNALNSNIECVSAFTFEFSRSITGRLQIPATSLLGSVETNFSFPSPPFNQDHISGIC